MSNWPTHSDYQDAMQNPSVCFSEDELKGGEPKLDMLGLPRVMSGNFASVYELKTAQNRWAIRCFVRQVPGQQGRYARLSQYLNNLTMPWLVDFEYLLKGILVKGEFYPIVKMRWVDGMPLNAWVEENLSNPEALKKIAADWRNMMKDLAANKVAHGDLQHGNIMVTTNNELRLVDYDGMYAPVFGRGRAPELGHINFQHPRRTADFYQEDLDNFSGLVIYTSLLALAAEPELWQKFYTVDNLVLMSADYKNPLNSPALTRLKASKDPQVQKLAGVIEKCCLNPVENVPDFLNVMDALDKGTLDTLPMKTPSSQTVSFSRPAPEGATTVGSRPAPQGSRPAPAQAVTPAAAAAAKSGTRSAYDNVPTVATQPLKKTQATTAKSPGYVPPPEPARSGGIPGWVWGVAGALVAGVIALVLASRKGPELPSNDSVPRRPPTESSEPTPTPTESPAETPKAASPQSSLKVNLLIALKGGHSGSVDVLAFSAGGKYLASGSADKTIRIWDAQNGQPKPPPLTGSGDAITSLAFLTDGKTLCSVSADNVVRFWDTTTGNLQRKLEDYKDNPFPVAVSKDGHSLATGSPNDRKTVLVVDPLLGSTQNAFKNHSSWIKAVGFSPNGKMLVSICHDDSVNILDTASGKIVHTLNIPGNTVEQPVFSYDNKMLATASDGRNVKVWDVASGTVKQTFSGHNGDVKCCAFSPDGKSLATGAADMMVKVWDVATGAEKQSLSGHGNTVTAVAFSSDGALLASSGADQTIRLFEVK